MPLGINKPPSKLKMLGGFLFNDWEGGLQKVFGGWGQLLGQLKTTL